MRKHYDVIALGELLIDFTENGQSTQANPLLEANPGGAPCNVLAMLQKLGKRNGSEQIENARHSAAAECRFFYLEKSVVMVYNKLLKFCCLE